MDLVIKRGKQRDKTNIWPLLWALYLKLAFESYNLLRRNCHSLDEATEPKDERSCSWPRARKWKGKVEFIFRST